jgi:carboxyl-terminal processing protease
MDNGRPTGQGDYLDVSFLSSKRLAGVAAAFLLAGLWGCAEDGPPLPRGPDATFPSLEAESVFTAGLAGISERYIDEVTIGALAVEGIRGFGAIDPGLSLIRQGDALQLYSGERLAEAFQVPRDDNPRAWARTIVSVTLAAREVSEMARAAGTEKVYEAVFDAALASLDLYSRYAGSDEAAALRNQRNGGGNIGIFFRMVSGGAEVTLVQTESPAAMAGIEIQDLLTHVEDQPIDGMTERELAKLLSGPLDSSVRVKILKNNGSGDHWLSLKRVLLVPPTVAMAYRDGIAHIKVSGFNQGTADAAANRLREAKALSGGRLKGVLLDLRGNPGGLLDQAVATADHFLNSGRIVATRGRHAQAAHNHEATEGEVIPGLPVVVLVDGRSASSAEIVAAALQDRGRAVVVGTNTFGKGNVQTVIDLPNGGEISLTWSRFLAPSGYALQGLGVLPNLCTASGGQGAKGISGLAGGELARDFAAWRTSGVGNAQARKQLRAACPAEEGAGEAEEAGRRLLQDPALYAKALGMISPGNR